MEVKSPVRILMLEDDEKDAQLNESALVGGGFTVECHRADTPGGLEVELRDFKPHVVLLDFNLPDFDGATALKYVREKHPEIPTIIVSGTLGDEAAVDLLRTGAADYVLKDRPARLASAVRRALEQEKQRKDRIATLRELEAKVILLKTEEESSPDGILVVDESAKIISRNQRFLEMCGYQSGFRILHMTRNCWSSCE